MSCCSAVKLSLSLQETASTRRAAPRCEPTLITFMSSTISRLCSNCHTDWSLGPKGQLWLCQPDDPSAREQHLSISQDSVTQDKTIIGWMKKYLQRYTTVRNRPGHHHPTAELHCQLHWNLRCSVGMRKHQQQVQSSVWRGLQVQTCCCCYLKSQQIVEFFLFFWQWPNSSLLWRITRTTFAGEAFSKRTTDSADILYIVTSTFLYFQTVFIHPAAEGCVIRFNQRALCAHCCSESRPPTTRSLSQPLVDQCGVSTTGHLGSFNQADKIVEIIVKYLTLSYTIFIIYFSHCEDYLTVPFCIVHRVWPRFYTV